MPSVETVAGPIDAGQLGLTLIHEHFFSGDEAVAAQWPHVRDHELEYRLALESAEAVKRRAVRTVVEPTAMLLGRDVRASRRLAAETGLQLIACTCPRSSTTGPRTSSPTCSSTTSSTGSRGPT